MTIGYELQAQTGRRVLDCAALLLPSRCPCNVTRSWVACQYSISLKKICPTDRTRHVGYSACMHLEKMRHVSPISDYMPYSTVARRARALLPATAPHCICTGRWGWFPRPSPSRTCLDFQDTVPLGIPATLRPAPAG